MFPLFIITTLIIFPSQASTIKQSKVGLSILKSNDNSNVLGSFDNIRIIDVDLNFSGNLRLGKHGQDKTNSAESIRSPSPYQYSLKPQVLLKTKLNLQENFEFMVSSNGIKQQVGIDRKGIDKFKGANYEGQKVLAMQSKNSSQQPAARIYKISRNQKKLQKKQFNQQEIQTNLNTQDQNTLQDDDFLEFNQERALQQGVLGGKSNEGVLNNTGPSLSPTDPKTNTTSSTPIESPVTTTPSPPTTSPKTPETTTPTSPPQTKTPTSPAQENNSTSKPSVTPQNPTNSSSTSKSNTDGPSVIVLVVAISVPIAIIAIILITCKVLKTPPQAEQADCKGTISQTNVGTAIDRGTTVDSSGAETNEGMHRVQENIDSRPQSVAS